MLKCDLMLCAQGVIRDIQTHAISVFNIIEELIPEGLPVLLQQFMVYAHLWRDITNDPSSFECVLKIATSDKTLFEHTINIDFQDKAKNHTIINVSGLVIPSVGALETSLMYGDDLLNSYVIQVNEPRKAKIETHSS